MIKPYRGNIQGYADLPAAITDNILLNLEVSKNQIADISELRTLTVQHWSVVMDETTLSAQNNVAQNTSMINTGSDFVGTKAITFCAWMRIDGQGNLNVGRIIDNGDGNVFILRPTSASSMAASSGTTLVATTYETGKWQFFSFTRKADGKLSWYVGDLNTEPALDGALDQDSGTPVAGTVNVIIGNRSIGSRQMDGLIKSMIFVDGILTLDQIKMIYQHTKGKHFWHR